MKVGTDGVLLGAWAPAPLHPLRLLDVGTGSGLIAVMLAQRFAEARITALDIDPGAVRQATLNAQASPFADRITVRQADVCAFAAEDRSDGFDAVVCNPPFFSASLRCPDAGRATARHDDTLTLSALASASARLLSPSGLLSVVLPADRLADMQSAAAIAGFFECSVCHVHTTQTKPAKRVLASYSLCRQYPFSEGHLVVGSDEYKALTDDFYL